MIYTSETLQLEEKVDELVALFSHSKEKIAYQKAYQAYLTSKDVAEKKAVFEKAKEAFDKVASYGLYAPDYKETYRALRKAKRALDLNPEVGNLKVAENTLQEELDQIAYRLSKFVSEDVKVDYGNPFFHQDKGSHSCNGGGCSSHGK